MRRPITGIALGLVLFFGTLLQLWLAWLCHHPPYHGGATTRHPPSCCVSPAGREHLMLYGLIKSAVWNWRTVAGEAARLLDKVRVRVRARVCTHLVCAREDACHASAGHVPPAHHKPWSRTMVSQVKLSYAADQRSGAYSGGMKRRLRCARVRA